MMFFLKALHKVNADLLIIHHSKQNEKKLKKGNSTVFFSIKYCLVLKMVHTMTTPTESNNKNNYNQKPPFLSYDKVDDN